MKWENTKIQNIGILKMEKFRKQKGILLNYLLIKIQALEPIDIRVNLEFINHRMLS